MDSIQGMAKNVAKALDSATIKPSDLKKEQSKASENLGKAQNETVTERKSLAGKGPLHSAKQAIITGGKVLVTTNIFLQATRHTLRAVFGDKPTSGNPKAEKNVSQATTVKFADEVGKELVHVAKQNPPAPTRESDDLDQGHKMPDLPPTPSKKEVEPDQMDEMLHNLGENFEEEAPAAKNDLNQMDDMLAGLGDSFDFGTEDFEVKPDFGTSQVTQSQEEVEQDAEMAKRSGSIKKELYTTERTFGGELTKASAMITVLQNMKNDGTIETNIDLGKAGKAFSNAAEHSHDFLTVLGSEQNLPKTNNKEIANRFDAALREGYGDSLSECVQYQEDLSNLLHKMTSEQMDSFMSQLSEQLKDQSGISQEYLNKLENKEISKNDLVSSLIAPVQRMPRHVLLLDTLEKNTPAEDKATVAAAQNAAIGISLKSNDSLREYQLTRLENKLKPLQDKNMKLTTTNQGIVPAARESSYVQRSMQLTGASDVSRETISSILKEIGSLAPSAENIQNLKTLIDSPSTSDGDRLKAQKQLNDLLETQKRIYTLLDTLASNSWANDVIRRNDDLSNILTNLRHPPPS